MGEEVKAFLFAANSAIDGRTGCKTFYNNHIKLATAQRNQKRSRFSSLDLRVTMLIHNS